MGRLLGMVGGGGCVGGMREGYGREGLIGRRGQGVQGGDLGFACVFVGDGAAHAGACCHVCGGGWWVSGLAGLGVNRVDWE